MIMYLVSVAIVRIRLIKMRDKGIKYFLWKQNFPSLNSTIFGRSTYIVKIAISVIPEITLARARTKMKSPKWTWTGR